LFKSPFECLHNFSWYQFLILFQNNLVRYNK
jgi:hypothetical protein